MPEANQVDAMPDRTKLSIFKCVGNGSRIKRGKYSMDDKDDSTADKSSSTDLSTESMAYVQSILHNVKHHKKRSSRDKVTMATLNTFDDSKGLLMNICDEMSMMSTWSESLMVNESNKVDYTKDEQDINTEGTIFSTPVSFVSLDDPNNPDSDPSFTDLAMNVSRFSVSDESRNIISELDHEAIIEPSSVILGMTSAVEYMMSMNQLTKSSDERLNDIEFESFDSVADYVSSMQRFEDE